MGRMKNPKRIALAAALFAAAAVTSRPLSARVRLVGLPPREAVRLDLGHETESLLQEERTLLLQDGVTDVEFSWQGVRIDPSTILLEPLEHPRGVEVIAVRYPPGENALVWSVRSDAARAERCRVTYLMNGIGRRASYRAVADTGEARLAWREYRMLMNGSGERLEGAEVALSAAPAGGAERFRTDLLEDESRERRLGGADVPFRKVLVWDAARMPHDPSREAAAVGLPVYYEFPNDAAHGLGAALLAAGKVRLFQDDGRGGTAFLGEDGLAASAVGETVAFSVGESRDVVVTRKHLETRRTREVGGAGDRAVLWDERLVFEVTVENFKAAAAAVRVVDHFTETWDVAEASHRWSRPDAESLRFDLDLAPGESEVVRFAVDRRNLHRGRSLR